MNVEDAMKQMEVLKKENKKLKRDINKRNAVIAKLTIKRGITRRDGTKSLKKEDNTKFYAILCAYCILSLCSMEDNMFRVVNRYKEFCRTFPSKDEKYNNIWPNRCSAHTVAYKYNVMNEMTKAEYKENGMMLYVCKNNILCYDVVPYIWKNMMVEL